MKSEVTWVTTFDGASCRVFTLAGSPGRLDEIVGASREGPHKPHFDERPGRVYSSVGPGRSDVSHHTEPERRMEDDFVSQLVQRLAQNAADGSFDRLIVAAGARALGAFRAAAPKALAEKVTREIHGNFVNGGPDPLLSAILGD